MRRNLAIHQRLGEGWFISLIVAVTAIADQVNYNVAFECLTIFHRQHTAPDYSLWIVCINVQNWSTNNFCDPGGIGT